MLKVGTDTLKVRFPEIMSGTPARVAAASSKSHICATVRAFVLGSIHSTTKIEFSILNGNLMVPAGRPHTFNSWATSPNQPGDFPMKTLSVVTFAILLGLGGAAMANGQESQQSNTNATGPNQFMPEFSTPASSGYSAFGSYPVPHHVAHHHVKK
jgi:hypothetical protein